MKGVQLMLPAFLLLGLSRLMCLFFSPLVVDFTRFFVLKLKLKLFTTCAGKLDRLLSLGPLYFAIQDLLASWARVSSTRYTYRHTNLHCVSTFLGS
jgi:hypothetical protein